MYAAKAARLQKTAVGLTPFVRFFSATFCGCWSLLRKALIRNRKTSYTAVALCETHTKFMVTAASMPPKTDHIF
jgi:hypothetical protein